ncbi:beta-mannosidase [Tieghemostelium lacteum]|uniref:Beta-mannosidase n=1 Tax=Tieghemostelium lacteum TaxID=361077 RepID=A0A151ZGV2_TIELA|nr:beta-mannosidase [Tieghemostelium lacteum]|eukprot:KYQ93100.1 beta-mannosidase [Tieghemostelium lacteum]
MSTKGIKQSLNGTWNLNLLTIRDEKCEDRPTSSIIKTIKDIPSTVPGEVHMDLFKHKLIPDLYIGEKELEYRWIACCDWVYTRPFQIDDISDFNKIELVCDGIDTIADIFINQKKNQ